MTRFAKKLSLRQQVIASAILFFRRFYVHNSYSGACVWRTLQPPNLLTPASPKDTEPCLVAATCVYVAAKVEEQPVHVKSVTAEARQLFHGKSLRVGYQSSIW